MRGNYNNYPMVRTRLLNMMKKRGYTCISQLLDDPNITLFKHYKITALLMLKEENPPMTKKRIEQLKDLEKIRTIRYHKKIWYDRPGSTIHTYYYRKE